MFVNSYCKSGAQSGIWYDIGFYENCINISGTITVARQNGGGFIRLLSLQNVD